MGHEPGHGLAVSQSCNQGLFWAMFSSEGLTEEVFIFTLIQVAARTHFLWPEDSGPGFLLAMGWRLPLGCGGHLQFLEATHSALSRGLSNLVMHFIKPLCSAWWWNLIQFNTVTSAVAVHGLLVAVSCCEAWAPGLTNFHSCGLWAQLPYGMWGLPGRGWNPRILHRKADY